MKVPQRISPTPDPEELHSLELEITTLENRLTEAERLVNNVQAQIRSQIYNEIHRVNELTDLYKQQKRDKKAKRLEQKKRGKNYKEPQAVQKPKSAGPATTLAPDDHQELKRLYKEAIVHV